MSYRVDKRDVILAYRILHGFMESIQWGGFFQMDNTSRLRGHSLKLKNNERGLIIAISHKVVYMCDGLPAKLVIASTTRAFKTKPDACL